MYAFRIKFRKPKSTKSSEVIEGYYAEKDNSIIATKTKTAQSHKVTYPPEPPTIAAGSSPSAQHCDAVPLGIEQHPKPPQCIGASMGRLKFNYGDGHSTVCTANVVPSPNGNVIATARHCGFDLNGISGTNYTFFPGYAQDQSNLGSWTWKEAFWMDVPDKLNSDFAFLVLNPNDKGQNVQNVTGSTGMIFNKIPPYYVEMWAIPGDIGHPFTCNGNAAFSHADSEGNFAQLDLPNCVDGLGGASGGGYYTIESGKWYQTAVHAAGSTGGTKHGALLGNAAEAAYTLATAASSTLIPSYLGIH